MKRELRRVLLDALVESARNPALDAPHNHDSWIIKARLSCPVCAAEDRLWAAAKRLRQGTNDNGKGA